MGVASGEWEEACRLCEPRRKAWKAGQVRLAGVGEGQLRSVCRRESSGHGPANLGCSSAVHPPWLSSQSSPC